MFILLRKYSIRLQLLCIGGVILLLLSGTVVWSYHQILNITYKRNSDYTIELISTIKRNIASNADTINRILPNIAYNEQIQEYLMEQDRLKQYELHGKIEKLLVNLKSMKQGIVDIVLVSTIGSSSYNCINCQEFIPLNEIPERTSAYYSALSLYPYSNPMKQVVYVGVPVYDRHNQVPLEAKIGYAIMVLDVNAIAPQIDSMSDKTAGSFYVLDRNRVVTSSNDLSQIGKRLPELEDRIASGTRNDEFRKDGAPYVIHAEPIPEIAGQIVSIYPTKELFRGLEEVQHLVIGTFIAVIVVMYVLYIAISHNILQPIRSFMTFIYGLRAKGLNNLNKRVALEGYAEISIMAKQVNALLDEIDDLASKLIDSKTHIFELQLMKKQAELQYLKSQINPHFLYNTMETIKGIAFVKGVDEIRDMTDALSRVFRYSIKGEEHVALKEELDIVEAYINIQQIRFVDRFHVRYDFEEACCSCKVIKMVLQPLVENAVFHGIEPALHNCTLTVGCRMEDHRNLLLWVIDDGVGMEHAMLEQIRQSLEVQPPASNNINMSRERHVGIINVNNRIKFAYGDQYGIMSIDSVPGEGTKVLIKIPVIGGSDV
ncbi:sensor histidine kinase [Paenibacillus sp. H1-7]|uniref:cache domain-containing sensor histidine kinase n=1 Tax=Paenibacillus sp. H1-7 TaxID=2282849 RepID=UPI001EF93F37|nr:sensor histidine kinase [Paenibacillus sp. H1-7]ULL13553.1 sensor histidine kinase [Paenibacillus sp. H1-7]